MVAQNLVPDPGFEITSEGCEPYPGLVHWYSPTLGTPDLYRYSEGDCGNVLSEDQSEDLQFPPSADGEKMVGLFCCFPENSSTQGREYLSTSLIQDLESMQLYHVSLKIHRTLVYNLAIDKIGVLFTSEIVDFDITELIPISPQLESDLGVLDSEEEWIQLDWDFWAQGGESVLTVGCFRDFDEMEVANTGSSWKNFDKAYYLIDDVHVEADTSISVRENTVSTRITQQGAVIFVEAKEISQIQLINLNGEVILSNYPFNNSKSLNLQKFAKGIYLLKIISQPETLVFKVFLP